MRVRAPARSEMVLIGLIVLLLVTIALLPWRHFAAMNAAMQSGKYSFINMRKTAPPSRNTALWRANADYSAISGTLHVRLASRYDEPHDGLSLHAEFFTGSLRAPAAAARLHGGNDGSYSARGLRLAQGNWIIGLTGTRRSEFVFRIEQPLTVE